MAFAAIFGAIYTSIYIWHSNEEPDKKNAGLHCGRCGLCPEKNDGGPHEKCVSEIKLERGRSNE